MGGMNAPVPLRWQGKWFVALYIGKSKTRKTDVWRISGQVELGQVGWYAPWRRYAFYPNPNTIYEPDCLRDLATFCEERTRAHVAKRIP